MADTENTADNLNNHGKKREKAGTENWEGIKLNLALNLEPKLTLNTSLKKYQSNSSPEEVVCDGPKTKKMLGLRERSESCKLVV